MRFTINPFTDDFDCVGLGTGVPVEQITGNTGTVTPDSSFNVNILGNNASGLNTVGSGSTLTIFGLASTTTQIGTTRYATNAEAAAQSLGTAALTPSNIPSLFSTTPLPASQGGTGLSSPAANSLLVTNGSSPFTILGVAGNGQLPIGSIGGNPVLANITAGAGITISNGPGTITISSTTGTLQWTVISGNQTLVTEHGYICGTPGGALALLLPATSIVGDIIEITLDGATSFQVTQAAGQQIRIGSASTTLGATGTLTSNAQGDSIRMVCSVANTKWNVVSSMGTLTTA